MWVLCASSSSPLVGVTIPLTRLSLRPTQVKVKVKAKVKERVKEKVRVKVKER